jgi:CheY-like chemotaxis protein
VDSDKKRILVVDDSEDLRELYRMVLEAADYVVDSASGGVEAFVLARARRPDLVISDVVMPGMDGLELLQRLRSDLQPPVPPVILCSGFDMTETEAMSRGALMFLRKPFESAHLLDSITRGLRCDRGPTDLDRSQREQVDATRQRTRSCAAARVQEIHSSPALSREQLARLAAGPLEWLRAYFGVSETLVSLFHDGKLETLAGASSGASAFDLAAAPTRPELHSVLETGAALVISDVAAHPCFAPMSEALPNIRFFAGVPLTTHDGAPVGVLCVADRRPRTFALEDLELLQQFARRGSILVRLMSGQSPHHDLPGRFGAGVLVPSMFAMLVDLELKLLESEGGSFALAAVEGIDVATVRTLLARAGDRERLAAGAWSPGRVGISARNRDGNAGARIDELVRELLRDVPDAAVGVTALSGVDLPAFTSQDLMRLSWLALDRAISVGGGTAHLALAGDVVANP